MGRISTSSMFNRISILHAPVSQCNARTSRRITRTLPQGTHVRNKNPAPTGGYVCFRCVELGHYANRCPKSPQNTLALSNSSRQRKNPQQQQQQPRNNNQSPQSNKDQQNYVRGRVNHVAAETAQEAQDV